MYIYFLNMIPPLPPTVSPVTRMEATARAGFPPRRDAAGIPSDDMTDRCVSVMLSRVGRPTAPAAAAVPKRDVIDDHTVLATRGLCHVRGIRGPGWGDGWEWGRVLGVRV